MTGIETSTSSNRIEKRVLLKVPRSKVWRALSNAEEFGTWFGVKFEQPFTEGATQTGRITFKSHAGAPLEVTVERIQPEKLFSYRWHPYALDPAVDYSTEPTTLVEFRLEDAEGGTELTIVETGFDRIPASRRAEAFRMNDGGWVGQAKALERYVTGG